MKLNSSLELLNLKRINNSLNIQFSLKSFHKNFENKNKFTEEFNNYKKEKINENKTNQKKQ